MSQDYNLLKVPELRELITDKEDFVSVIGVSLSSARKSKLVEYLQKKNGTYTEHVGPKLPRASSETDLSKLLTNKPFNPAPPKVDKNFVPDTSKLEKIRENIPQPEPKTPTIQLDDEVIRDLDDEDVHKLNNIISGEETFEAPSYVYNETSEVKCKKYAELYPNIKPILSSPDFKSSDEKLKYIEGYLNSTRMNANLTNYLFMATTYIERNNAVNQYIKLKGYTKRLATRRNELETYIEELKIKYMDEVGQYLEMPVEARIGLLFAETALTVHMENNQNEMKQQVSQNINRPQPEPQPPKMN